MLRKLLIFALFLNVPGMQAYNQPNKTEEAEKRDQPTTNATLSPPQNDGRPNLQAEPQEQKQYMVRIVSAPSKDGYDLTAFGANLILVVVGVTGIIVGCLTLGKIRTQAEEMKLQRIAMQDTLTAIRGQADTMTQQAEDSRASAKQASLVTESTLAAIEGQAKEMSRQNKNMISRERARVAVSISRIESVNFRGANEIKIHVENLGLTHAFNVRTHGDARPLISGTDPPEMQPDDFIWGVESVLRANATPTKGTLIFIFPDEWIEDMELSKLPITIEAWGVIEYEDVFAQPHKTSFRYFMNMISTNKVPMSDDRTVHPFCQWLISEKPEDNYAT